jgi:hypothetical protein
MLDYINIMVGGAFLSAAVTTYLWLSARIGRDEAIAYLRREEMVVQALENRVQVLRGDNLDLQKINTELTREIGRLRAEQRASKPKRGPNGKFVAKPKANV